jgi:hypothetical protein
MIEDKVCFKPGMSLSLTVVSVPDPWYISEWESESEKSVP